MEFYIQVVTTTEKKEDAEKIAKTILEKRLAGCVQIVGPILSTYWWKDALETVEEWQCLMKTRKDLYGAVEKAVKAIHPYETPEIIAIPIATGSKEYLKWLHDEIARNV
ncbi:MAG: cytochrome C biogenesis protein CcdA [Syntrophaceae bacterium CG2_30_49_12]|nr:MAG: cytochrome C biogenesis protein CcdA [Syntrophaceae bacterium CG2_30_49_12]PJC74450.1 MAG: cytochrome C biogenesis protein CcdA [Syntrophobacterales bacterium CG_4_8_14_3_um_filter_49_14]